MRTVPRQGTAETKVATTHYDYARFWVDYGAHLYNSVQVRLDGEIVYLSHSDPKGLSYCEIPIEVFGEAMRDLIRNVTYATQKNNTEEETEDMKRKPGGEPRTGNNLLDELAASPLGGSGIVIGDEPTLSAVAEEHAALVERMKLVLKEAISLLSTLGMNIYIDGDMTIPVRFEELEFLPAATQESKSPTKYRVDLKQVSYKVDHVFAISPEAAVALAVEANVGFEPESVTELLDGDAEGECRTVAGTLRRHKLGEYHVH